MLYKSFVEVALDAKDRTLAKKHAEKRTQNIVSPSFAPKSRK